MNMQKIKLSSKKLISGLIIVGGIIFSANASAKQPSIEKAVTAFIVNQSQQLVQEMGIELKQSIATGIKNLTFTDALILISADEIQVVSKNITEDNTSLKNRSKTNLSTKKSAE